MTHDLHGVSRRSVLAALGAVGVTATASGVATYGYLADRERLDATLAAGRVDLRADYRAVRGDETVLALPESLPSDAGCSTADLIDGGVLPTTTFENVVPGESGTLSSCVYVCGNPTYLWLRACVDDDAELNGGPTDREDALGDTDDAGELAGAIRATLYLDENGDGVRDPAEPVVFSGSLAALDDAACAGIPLGPAGTATTDGTNDGPGEYAGTPVPDLSPDECVALGKLNVTEDGSSFDGELEPGDDVGPEFGDSVFRGVEYDETADRYAFTTDAGETVLLRITDVRFKPDEDEIIAATLTLDSPGLGFCRARVKTGGPPGTDDTSDTDYPDCPRRVRVETPVENRAISHVTLFVCGTETEAEPPEPVCYDPGRHCLGVEWELPTETGVEASTDTVSLDLAVAGAQCRHEMDPAARNPFPPLDAADGGDR
jgi:hypothetical protein